MSGQTGADGDKRGQTGTGSTSSTKWELASTKKVNGRRKRRMEGGHGKFHLLPSDPVRGVQSVGSSPWDPVHGIQAVAGKTESRKAIFSWVQITLLRVFFQEFFFRDASRSSTTRPSARGRRKHVTPDRRTRESTDISDGPRPNESRFRPYKCVAFYEISFRFRRAGFDTINRVKTAMKTCERRNADVSSFVSCREHRCSGNLAIAIVLSFSKLETFRRRFADRDLLPNAFTAPDVGRGRDSCSTGVGARREGLFAHLSDGLLQTILVELDVVVVGRDADSGTLPEGLPSDARGRARGIVRGIRVVRVDGPLRGQGQAATLEEDSRRPLPSVQERLHSHALAVRSRAMRVLLSVQVEAPNAIREGEHPRVLVGRVLLLLPVVSIHDPVRERSIGVSLRADPGMPAGGERRGDRHGIDSGEGGLRAPSEPFAEGGVPRGREAKLPLGIGEIGARRNGGTRRSARERTPNDSFDRSGGSRSHPMRALLFTFA